LAPLLERRPSGDNANNVDSKRINIKKGLNTNHSGVSTNSPGVTQVPRQKLFERVNAENMQPAEVVEMVQRYNKSCVVTALPMKIRTFEDHGSIDATVSEIFSVSSTRSSWDQFASVQVAKAGLRLAQQ